MCKSIQFVFFSTLTGFSETTHSWSKKLRSDLNSVRRGVSIVLLLAGGVGVATSAPNPMPDSEINYPGASATSAFVAKDPYQVNVKGALKTIQLYGVPRKNDYSGNVPFVNPGTNYPDPATIQAWNSSTGSSVQIGSEMTNAGLYGRVDKQTFGSTPVTMVRYNKGDGITIGKCRSQLNSWVIPSRTHTRWELEVAFGKADGVNDWTLTPTGASPVLVWQMHSSTQSHPPLAVEVDTDAKDPTKLMISFKQRVGTATMPQLIARVNGISRNTMVPIVLDAFMDERDTANGGKGLLQIWVNNVMILDKIGPTRDAGGGENYWSTNTYLFTEGSPYPYTRSTFWKTARMLVFPVGATSTPTGTTSTADTTAPSVPTNFAATAPDSTKVNLSWSASTDNVGVAGYKVYRNGTQIMRNNVTSFTDTSVVAGTTYNYTVQAFDAAGNFSASSTATVTVPTTLSSSSNSLPDVIVTGSSYAGGIFTSIVKNQGTAATPAGVVIGVGYFVDGIFRTWGSVTGPLAAGASVTIGTKGGAYTIPQGTHTITVYVDDINRFAESNETNNKLSQQITVQ